MTAVVVSPLLSEVRPLVPRPRPPADETAIPAWITDPNVRADILAGFLDLPDDLAGGA